MAVSVRLDAMRIITAARPYMERRLRKATQELADHVKQKLSNGRRGAIGTHGVGAGYPPHVDTGALRQSIFGTVLFDTANKRMIGRVGTTKVYGLYLELGAYIRPRSGKLLAIPWSPEAVAHGRRGGSAKDFPVKMIPIRTKTGAVLLIQYVAGKAKRGVIHYILTSHANIPAHPFLRPSLAEMTPRIREIFAE